MTEEKQATSYIARGSSKLVVTEHSTRHMRSYLIYDSELKSISMLNGLATLFFSLGSFCASITLGLWSNLFATDSPSEIAKKYGSILESVLGTVSGACFLIAFVITMCRQSEVSRIKRESGEVEIPLLRRCLIKIGVVQTPEN